MHYTPLIPFGLVVTAENDDESLNGLSQALTTELMDKHLLLVFRQFSSLSDGDYINFAKKFGDILAWEFGEILELKISPQPANHIFTKGRVELHWDGAFVEKKPHFNLFNCIKGSKSSSGGQTLFVDTTAVLAQATPEDINAWSNITIQYQTEKKAHYGGLIQSPLICRSLFTDEKIIRYIEAHNEDNEELNPMQVRLLNTTEQESEQFLKEFTQRLYADQFMYRHNWCAGDVLIADNSRLLHGRSRYENTDVDRYIKRINIL